MMSLFNPSRHLKKLNWPVSVKTISLRKFATAPFIVGTLLLLCALTFYYFAVLRVDYSRTVFLDLGPRPDATEYFAQAEAMLHGRWPSIQIGYEKLPSRYPLGYPALMLPWLKVLPAANAVLAPFRTNQTLGLLLLLVVFGFYAYIAMPLTGGFAALLLATLPGFFTYCRSSISEIGASLLIVLAFMFVVPRVERGTPLENLFISFFLRPFTKHSNSVDFLRTLIVSHGSVPNARNAPTLASSLHCGSVRPCAGY